MSGTAVFPIHSGRIAEVGKAREEVGSLSRRFATTASRVEARAAGGWAAGGRERVG